MKQIISKISRILAFACLLLLTNASLEAQGLFKTIKQVKQSVSDEITKETGISKKPTATATAANNSQSSASTIAVTGDELTAYSKYDFVPGQSIIYAEDFSDASIGELPVGWNSNGSGVAVKLSNTGGKWLKLGQSSVYLAPNKIPAGDDFTIEFDLLMQFTSIGSQGFPTFRFGALATNTGVSNGDNSLLRQLDGSRKFEVTIMPYINKKSEVMMTTYKDGRTYLGDPFKEYSNIENYYGKVSHVAIQIQKERLRIWMNGEKLYEAPKGIAPGNHFNQLFFALGNSSYTNEQQCVSISNIKMANGLPDMRKQLFDKGSYSTTGILFDVNSANIKPESSGAILEIAAALSENPDIKIKITGHTDADGNMAGNKALSIERANAVKEKLTTIYNINADRITTDGVGSSQPVGDDKTTIGKAQNRRVEFTKQ